MAINSPVWSYGTVRFINCNASNSPAFSYGTISILYDSESASFFSDSSVADGTNALSYINKETLVSMIQTDSPDIYLDTTDEISRVKIFYTHQDNRQKKIISHDGPDLIGSVSWSPIARDGTWQKTKVIVFNHEGSRHELNRAAIGSAEDIIHASGVMYLNTI